MSIEQTRLVGVTFDNRQNTIKNINPMMDLLVPAREPENPYDHNAINVFVKKPNGNMYSVGYINRHLAAKLAPQIDGGKTMHIMDFAVTGGISNNLGVVLRYMINDPITYEKD